MNGILLNNDFDLLIQPKRVNGLIVSGMVVGNIDDQNAVMVMSLNPGDLKEDPLLGPGLNRLIRGKENANKIDTVLRVHFTRAGLNWDDFKDRINYTINSEE